MPRLEAVAPSRTDGRAKDLLDGVQKKLGRTPNLMRTMANSPAALDGYLSFSGTLQTGVLSTAIREQIALTVGEVNGCEYCLTAHSAIGRMVGLVDSQIEASRSGLSDDPKVQAVLTFARRLVVERGRVSDTALADAKSAGVTDEEIAEIVANVARNIFTNYFNLVADTQVDFPAAPKQAAA